MLGDFFRKMGAALRGWVKGFLTEGAAAVFIKLCRTGTPEAVAAALRSGADVNARDKRGITALMWAACNSNPEVVEVLLEAGANVDARCEDSVTALMVAIEENPEPRVVSALLNAGADIDAKNKEGRKYGADVGSP